jgi:signal peptide peptidase SppA
MTNPFLTNRAWAMHAQSLKAMAAQASAFDFDDLDQSQAEPAPYEVVNGVAIMQLCGPLMKYDDIFTQMFGGSSTLSAQQNIQAALLDSKVTATLLIIDSPGGEVSGTGDLAETIANSTKPVIAYISDKCASGAYWAASQADYVFCNSTASVGSIGVYCVWEDTSQAYADAGVKVTLIKAGDFKGTGADGVPISDDQIAEEQREVNEIYEMFVDAVANGRSMTNSQAKQLATGQSWIASKAKDLGLVDGIASLDDVFGMLSGGQMAQKKMMDFAVSKASKANAKVAEEVTEKVETVETPVIEDKKVEAPAIAVEPAKEEIAPVVAVEPEMVQVAKDKFEALVADSLAIAEKIKEARAIGFEEGQKDEKARLASLKEIAPEDHEFVLEQFAAGIERGKFAVAFATRQTAKLKEALAANANAVTGGAKAVAIGSLEGRAATKDKQPMSFINIK